MSEPIGVGDWIECIGDNPKGNKPTRGASPEIGSIYQVRSVFRGCYRDGSLGDGVKLVGLEAFNASGREGGWPVEMFRPIYRPKASIIEALKAPVTRTPKVVQPTWDDQKVNAQ